MAYPWFVWVLLLVSQPRPDWWERLVNLERLESAFTQVSESAVFGTVTRNGTLRFAKGGRLRVVYETGLCFVADGRTLVHYDPATRTAQRVDVRAAAREVPLLALLLDPTQLEQSFRVEIRSGGRLRLEPRQPGLPTVEVEGRSGFLERLTWTDPTGARQVLQLSHPRVPKNFPEGTFVLKVPPGTRWLP